MVRTAPLVVAGWGLVLAICVPIAAIAAAATIVGLPLGLALCSEPGSSGSWARRAVTFAIGRLSCGHLVLGWARGSAGWGIGAAIGLVPFLNVAWWTLGSIVGLGAIWFGLACAAWCGGPDPGGWAGRHTRRGRARTRR